MYSNPWVRVLQSGQDGIHGDCGQCPASYRHQQCGRLHPFLGKGWHCGCRCCCGHRVLQGNLNLCVYVCGHCRSVVVLCLSAYLLPPPRQTHTLSLSLKSFSERPAVKITTTLMVLVFMTTVVIMWWNDGDGGFSYSVAVIWTKLIETYRLTSRLRLYLVTDHWCWPIMFDDGG